MISKLEQAKAFEAIYEGLNQHQKIAVDTIEGPVMVIAGPGTGKTQILGARIGKILLETDTAPENILCLTYTDAGAIAMRKRLVSFIGTSAYKVNIATFHSFCNDIIQDNLSLFDKTSLDPISELEKIELLKKLIDSFDKNYPLKRYRGDIYYEMGNLEKLFSTIKKEGWTPAYLINKVDEYLKEIPFRNLFKDLMIQFYLALSCVLILLIIDNIFGFILSLCLLALYFRIYIFWILGNCM
jgi:DNA helicase-2/ATP-dependent DNA helicase PcrA